MHVLRRTYKYRLYPTRRKSAALDAQVNEACRLYNAALDERRSAWRMQRVSIRLSRPGQPVEGDPCRG